MLLLALYVVGLKRCCWVPVCSGCKSGFGIHVGDKYGDMFAWVATAARHMQHHMRSGKTQDAVTN